ncbi:MAG TPA: hypothetical protein VM488_18100 [Pseudobacter sp.]|nr:hypothetical protein [Pseudobacter sp.]
MLKNWKSLFVKTDGDSSTKEEPPGFSFPVTDVNVTEQPKHEKTIDPLPSSAPMNVVQEVIATYEAGLDAINMPGYDFYEFYMAVSAGGATSPQTYQMAFSMAKAFDKNVTPAKLLQDAEFYISKINEVHGQYVSQGQQKLNALSDQRNAEQRSLQQEADHAEQRIRQLKTELQQLETLIKEKQQALATIDNKTKPQENSIREKLQANDLAKKASIDKLSAIKNGIQQYIKA